MAMGRLGPGCSKPWGAKGTPLEREALPVAEGGAKRRPNRPPEISLSAEGAIGELARQVWSTCQWKHGCSLHG